MARKKMPYEAINYLSAFVLRKQHELTKKGDWNEKITLREIEEDLAHYCSVSRDAISLIKRGVNQPSLAVALKIAKYFNVPVEEIFKLDEDVKKDKEEEKT